MRDEPLLNFTKRFQKEKKIMRIRLVQILQRHDAIYDQNINISWIKLSNTSKPKIQISKCFNANYISF